MLLNVLERFVEKCPAAVMVRATLERIWCAEKLDRIFLDAGDRQYQKRLLFSQIVAIMDAVATRVHSSVHSAYLAAQAELGVSATALYGKLNRLEPAVSAALVRETAQDAAQAIDDMPGAKRTVLKGLHVQYLDGNHLAATEHRLAELRITREGPLPGHTLALMDAQRDLIADLIPCEDGHAQERSLLPALLERIAARTVTVADRNFCTTKFLFGLHQRNAYFIIRQHKSTLSWRPVGKRKRVGRVLTGILFEEQIELTQEGRKIKIRRITVQLDKATENGDTEIHILTNLSRRKATARKVAAIYRSRWTIEFNQHFRYVLPVFGFLFVFAGATARLFLTAANPPGRRP